jgi:TetR/AcrR family transcriptional regulator, transcriptional repressor for nem operon
VISENDMPTSTREEILRVTRNLIQTRSYLGFSFQDVAEQVGIRKASLYHHFRTKEALGVQVLREASRAFLRWSDEASVNAEVKLNAYFDLYRWDLRAGAAMCPAGAMAPGWDCIEPQLQGAVLGLRDQQIRWLTGVFSTDPRNRRRAGDLAAFVFAACQGALLSARMTGAVEDFECVIAHVRTAIAAKTSVARKFKPKRFKTSARKTVARSSS